MSAVRHGSTPVTARTTRVVGVHNVPALAVAGPGKDTGRRPAADYAPYLEGLRGLAALYVVLHHAALQAYDATYDSENLSVFAAAWLTLCDRGDLAVTLFIVLSGYCLMLPVVRTGQLRDGLLGYLRRRAQRILPAYYAVLCLVLSALWLVPQLNEQDGTRWDLALPGLERSVVLSHLLLVQNFDADWIWKLDGPLWSVAVEWQLYCLFPALVVVFRLFGARAGIATALSLGYLLTSALLAWNAPLAVRTCPWYLGLFAIGMATAVRAPEAAASGRHTGHWLWLTAFLLGSAWLVQHSWPYAPRLAAVGCVANMLVDPLVALALACLLLHCSSTARPGRVRAALEKPLWLWLGSFSYSLYLLHDPLLSFVHRALIALGLGAETRLWASTFVAVPLALACSYGLFLLIERPLLPRRPGRACSS